MKQTAKAAPAYNEDSRSIEFILNPEYFTTRWEGEHQILEMLNVGNCVIPNGALTDEFLVWMSSKGINPDVIADRLYDMIHKEMLIKILADRL